MTLEEKIDALIELFEFYINSIPIPTQSDDWILEKLKELEGGSHGN